MTTLSGTEGGAIEAVSELIDAAEEAGGVSCTLLMELGVLGGGGDSGVLNVEGGPTCEDLGED